MDSVFGIGFPELITIFILAGIVMGPARIGRVARWLGRTTAQLQAISRGFMRQLSAELESVDDGGELKSAMHDIKDLQRQLSDLRSELKTQTNDALKESKEVVADIENTIKPPSLGMVADDETTSSENGAQTATDSSSLPQMPNVVDIPEDPE